MSVMHEEDHGWLVFQQIVKECHANSLAHGWWPEETRGDRLQTIPTKLMLIVSEAAEALECYRDGDMEPALAPVKDVLTGLPPAGAKPIGFPSELADIVIRVFDLAGALGVDLAEAVRLKMAYNAQRPYRHGGKAV